MLANKRQRQKWGKIQLSENSTKPTKLDDLKILKILFCKILVRPHVETVDIFYLRLLNCSGNFGLLLMIYAGL